MKRILFILSVALITISSAYSQEKVDLRFNFNKKDVYSINTRINVDINMSMMGQEMDMQMSMETGLRYHIKKVKRAIYDMDCLYDKMSMSMNIPLAELTYDFSSENAENGQLLDKIFASMKNSKVSLSMSDKGRISDVSGLESVVDSMAEAIEGATENEEEVMEAALLVESLRDTFSETNFFSNTQMFVGVLPEDAVEVGDKWIVTNTLTQKGISYTYNITFELMGEKEGCYWLKGDLKVSTDDESRVELEGFEMEVSLEGDGSSEFLLDKETCWVKTGNLNMDVKGSMKFAYGEEEGEAFEMPVKYAMDVVFSGEKR